jgi:hypothetical protein
MEKERTIVIDISLNKAWALVLVGMLMIVALLGYAALSGADAEASRVETLAVQSDGMRQFYLTQFSVHGDLPVIKCAPGYHFASLWEISDPSNLKYNSSLGFTQADSGEGPPSGIDGWIRTGYESTNETVAGRGNCHAWTSDFGLDDGTVAYLPADWIAGDDDINVWAVRIDPCEMPNHIWCIED